MADYCTVGYHGTTKYNAAFILTSKKYIDSNDPDEWLGKGFYFFAHRYDAEQWILRKIFWGKATCILEAELHYNKEQLLDLDDRRQLLNVEDVVKRAVEKAQNEGKQISICNYKKTRQERMCFACNLMRFVNPNIGIIIYTFARSGNSDFQREYFSPRQRQICVSDHAIIHSIRMEGC